MNYAIILSGGVGSRTGLDIPKQYHKLNGTPLIQYVINTITRCEFIDGYIIVAAPEWQSFITETIKSAEKTISSSTPSRSNFMGYARPGINRQLSIYNGLQLLESSAEEEDIVLIQDAARPYTSAELIHKCFSLNPDEDGAMPVLPMTDTVYLSKDGKSVSDLLDRSQIYAGQAPESFRFGKYLRANEDLLPNKIQQINGSTEPAILAGMKITMIPGDKDNIKITTASDFNKVNCFTKGNSRAI